MNDIVLLSGLSFLTSCLAAVIGLGGGMLLIGAMPFFLPPSVVVPIHGVTQFASNCSRAMFSFSHILWHLVPGFLLGSALGAVLFGVLLFQLPTTGIPLFIGVYILLSQWSEQFNQLMRRFERFWIAGFIQTGVGMFVGATGPLTTALICKHTQQKDQIVATNAILMCISHSFKIAVFGVAGFVYSQYLWLIVGMIGAAMLGSWVGTLIRANVQPEAFVWLLKWMLTLLASMMIIQAVVRLA